MNYVKPFLKETAIAEKINEIARKLNTDCSHKTNVVLVSILKGSFLFTADLVRKLDFDFEIVFIEISSYGDKTTSGDINLLSEIRFNFIGKYAIVIEDIIDTGNTINFLELQLRHKGAENIDYVTLLIKNEKCKTNLPVKYFGFEIKDVFVAGYGMDYRGKYRNLPYIVDINDL